MLGWDQVAASQRESRTAASGHWAEAPSGCRGPAQVQLRGAYAGADKLLRSSLTGASAGLLACARQSRVRMSVGASSAPAPASSPDAQAQLPSAAHAARLQGALSAGRSRHPCRRGGEP
jgi:hypothetical protein